MLKSMRRAGSQGLAILLCLSLTFTPFAGAVAQVDDSEPPVLIHRQLDSGVAGELQTFLARVSDDFGVEEVVLYYRQSDTGQFQSLNMRPLVDSIGEYMIAVETSDNAYSGLQYYIEAIDMSGNITNRGFDYAPIVLPLTAPVIAPTESAPEIAPEIAIARPEAESVPQNEGVSVGPVGILLGIGALLALGALAGGSSDDDPPSETPVPTTPGTVTLTVISDLPSVE